MIRISGTIVRPRIEGLLYVVVYTLRGETTHVISARRAHQKEWERWLT